MQIIHSKDLAAAKRSEKIARVLETFTEAQLREWVERISVPRHYIVEPEANRAAADWIHETFASLGFEVARQGFIRTLWLYRKSKFRKRFWWARIMILWR